MKESIYVKGKKSIMVILLLCLAVSVYFNYQYYLEVQKNESNYERFLNYYNGAVYSSLNNLNHVLDNNDQTDIRKGLTQLSHNLNTFAYISSRAAYLVEDVYPVVVSINFFEHAAHFIQYGVKHDGILIPPIIEDGRLSSMEKAYLKAVKQELDYLQGKLTTEESSPNEADLTIYEFNEIAQYVNNLGRKQEELLDNYLEQKRGKTSN